MCEILVVRYSEHFLPSSPLLYVHIFLFLKCYYMRRFSMVCTVTCTCDGVVFSNEYVKLLIVYKLEEVSLYMISL